MKHKKLARILACLAILVILALTLLLLYCAITGKNFFGSLYLVIVVPVIIWAILFFAGCFRGDEEQADSDKESPN